MIELRWLILKVPRPRGIDEGFYSPPLPDTIETQTLQYREWPTGCIPGLTEPEWKDVPTVET